MLYVHITGIKDNIASITPKYGVVFELNKSIFSIISSPKYLILYHNKKYYKREKNRVSFLRNSIVLVMPYIHYKLKDIVIH